MRTQGKRREVRGRDQKEGKMILTKTELIELSVRTRPAAIKRWLDDARIPYLTGADNWPKVAAVVVDSRLGAIEHKHEPQLRLA